MDSTGEILRRARNDRQLTLDELATRTRINRKYLAAIESGDREAIPGGFFYKSFVRQYAAALSTEESNVLEEVEQSMAAEQPAPPPPPDEELMKALAAKAEENAPPVSASHSATAYAILLLLAIAGTSGLYVLWHRAQQAEAARPTPPPQTSKAAPSPPERAASQPPAQPAPTQPPPAQAEPQPPPAVAPTPEGAAPNPAQPSSGPAGAQPQPTPAQPTTTQPAPAQPTPIEPAPESGAAANPAPNPDNKIALSVSATQDTWFSFASDGKIVFSGVLKAGQSKTLGAKENGRLRIGNAAGLDVVFNGKSAGALGASGQVVTLLFTPEGYEVEKPKPPDTPPPQPEKP